MASLIHIAEIAAILAVAYMLGWAVGYASRRMLAPRSVVTATIPEARLAAATGSTEALVKAPVIVPVADPAVEPPVAIPVPIEIAAPVVTAPSVEPVSETVAAEPVVVSAEPAPVVPEVAPVPEPVPPSPSPADAAPGPATTPVARSFRRFRPSPKPAPEPVIADVVPTAFTAAPASLPGIAWTGEIKGKSAVRAASPPPTATEPPVAEPGPLAEPVPSPMPPPAPPPHDEDAAMRAIEGGWSRVKARAMTDAPEMSDLGAAVAAATTAVEQVLAKAGIDVDTAIVEERPKGLGRPRNGIKDDLKRISGLGALDESTLNNLGVYHYDQVARWNAAQVTWMENHVFARGRIAREDWQSQARALIPPPSF